MKELIRTIPDYPQPGILYRDITPLLKAARYFNKPIDRIVALESRGFIFGSALAYALKKGFVPIRKQGRLPGDKIGYSYDLEYGTDRIEIHTDAIMPGEKILLVDDLLATGGTAEAACHLIKQTGGHIIECCFTIELPAIGGRSRLETSGHSVFSLWTFE